MRFQYCSIEYAAEPSYFTRFPGSMFAHREFDGWQAVIYPRDSTRCPISVGTAQDNPEKALEIARNYIEKHGDDF